MIQHESRLTLIKVERLDQTILVTAHTPEGDVRRDVYGFWENEDGHRYVIVGMLWNTARELQGFGELDLYVRDEKGNGYLVEYWSDHLGSFKTALSLTRYVESTATGVRRSGDLMTLEYVGPEGEPDAFTFARSSVAVKWAFWMDKSPSMLEGPQARYLMLPVLGFWHVDLAVPDDGLRREINKLLDMWLRGGWMLQDDDRRPKSDAGR